MERSKKKVQLWKKAIVHFALCFVMGFFTGFAPTGKSNSPIFSSQISPKNSPEATEILHQQVTTTTHASNLNRSLIVETQVPSPTRPKESEGVKLMETEAKAEADVESEEKQKANLVPRRLVIIVTPTSTRDKSQSVLLRRLANTIKLVSLPLLWIVVEKRSDSDEVSELLRKTGIMYRHLVFKENFTDPEEELDHQRNVALKHIEHHRLCGIVHFAGLYNVYDLAFFDELQDIEVFGTWPMALLSANKQKVIIEGPVCDSSQVIGWHLKKLNNESEVKPPIHVSSFAFNSSILWDPERWGRPSTNQQTSQNSIKFVKEVVVEDETKLKGIPPEECSKIMLWSLQLPTPHSLLTALDLDTNIARS